MISQEINRLFTSACYLHFTGLPDGTGLTEAGRDSARVNGKLMPGQSFDCRASVSGLLASFAIVTLAEFHIPAD